jgi:protein kinase/serine/threonine-protein kinase
MHLLEPPPDPRGLNPGISEELSAVVMKCLDKDPAQRYQSAAEMQAALNGLSDRPGPQPSAGAKWLRIAKFAVPLAAVAIAGWMIVSPPSCPPAIWKDSLAVLPIVNAGTQEASSNFLAGLQDEVTNRLTDIPRLRVVPTPSVNSIDVEGKSIPQIGKELGVGYLVRVTALVQGGRLEAKIYLFDAKRNVNPNPMIYRKDLADYRALQNEIADYTARTLGHDLNAEHMKNIARRGTDSLEAYGLYLEGMKTLEESGDDEKKIEEAIGIFRRAIAIDPDYALATWGLGYAYESLYYSQREEKDTTALENMYMYLNKASQLDPSFAETNVGLGWYYFNKRDNAKAFESFRKALELEPDGYIINRDAGAFLRSIGLYKHAIPYLKKAAKLSPFDPLPLTQIAQCWLYLGRCEKALAYTRKALEVRESDPDTLLMHVSLLSLTGRLDEADSQIKAMERFDIRSKRLPFLKEIVAALRAGRGKPYAFVNETPGVAPQGTYLYLSFAMKDEALANIQKGIDLGFYNGMYLYPYPSLAENPWYGDLRRDPRFGDLVKRQKELYDRGLKAFKKL